MHDLWPWNRTVEPERIPASDLVREVGRKNRQKQLSETSLFGGAPCECRRRRMIRNFTDKYFIAADHEAIGKFPKDVEPTGVDLARPVHNLVIENRIWCEANTHMQVRMASEQGLGKRRGPMSEQIRSRMRPDGARIAIMRQQAFEGIDVGFERNRVGQLAGEHRGQGGNIPGDHVMMNVDDDPVLPGNVGE